MDRLLEKRVTEGDSPLPPEALEHLRTCPRCRSVYNMLESDVPEWAVSDPLIRRIRANLARSIEPVSPLPPVPTLVARTSAVFVLLPLLLVGIFGPAGWRELNWAQRLGVGGVIAGSQVLLSLALCGLMVPACRPRLAPRSLLAACGAAFLGALTFTFPNGSLDRFLTLGLYCTMIGSLAVVPAAVALGWLARSGAVLSWTTTGAVVGMLAGLTASSVLLFHCATPEVTHQVVWHGGLLLACVTAGALLGALGSRQARV